MRRPRAIAARAGIGALIWLACTMPVAAHAVLVRSDPPDVCTGRFSTHDPQCAGGAVLATPPSTVRLVFTEPIEVVGDGIVVTGPSGTRVDQGPARTEGATLSVPIAATETGTYSVEWRITSDDTHPEGGRYAFSVGQMSATTADAAPEHSPWQPLGLALQTAARCLHFVGFALGFGTLAFRLLIRAPLGPENNRVLGWLVQAGIGALLVAEPCALLAQTMSLSTGSQLDMSVAADSLATSFGRALAQRAAAAVLLWVLVGVIDQGEPRAGWATLALGLALALADGEASHAVGTHPAWLGVGLNAIHIAAMGVWVGGLVAFLVILRQPAGAGVRATVRNRFGLLAGGSLALLTITGAAMAAQHLTTPTDLVTTAYGRVLGVKVTVVLDVALVALGGSLMGRIARNAWHGAERARWWWRGELLLLACILALAGLLVSLAPPT